MTWQVELHPMNPQHDLKRYCDEKGILLEAYCPLGSTSAWSLSFLPGQSNLRLT
jgi:glycerol 2-dehydrogenase (NADP+)